jgi:hypothetical protein
MKRCPACNRTYADDTLTFCLADGTLLSAPYDRQATEVLPNLQSTVASPTPVSPSGQSPAALPQRNRNRLRYAIILLLFLIIGAMVKVLWVQRPSKEPQAAPAANPSMTTTPTPTREPIKTVSNPSSPAPTPVQEQATVVKQPPVVHEQPYVMARIGRDNEEVEVFYRATTGTGDRIAGLYVEIGTHVEPGSLLMTVKVTMIGQGITYEENREIRSPVRGTVVNIFVKNQRVIMERRLLKILAD